jgi:hypothetical protein
MQSQTTAALRLKKDGSCMALNHTPRLNLYGRFTFGSFPFLMRFTGTRCLYTYTLENRASNCNGIYAYDYNIAGRARQPTIHLALKIAKIF